MAWLPLLASTLFGLWMLGKPAAMPLDGGTLLWVAAGVILELLSPRLPRFGFVSPAAALWLGLALQHPRAAWLALLGSLAGLLLRWARSLQPARWGPLEVLSDWQPLCLACGAANRLGQPWAAPVLWAVLWWLQPSLTGPALEEEVADEWALYRARLLGVAAGLACLGALLGLTRTQAGPPLGALAALALASSVSFLVRGVDAQTQQVEGRRRERGLQQRERGLDKLAHGLAATDKAQRRTQAELQVRLETYQLMDEMLEAIPRRPVFQAVAELIVQRLHQRFGVTNAVLFWREESQQLLPVAAATPYPERIAAAQLTRSVEPAVEKAVVTAQLQVLRNDHAAARLFPEDTWSVAVPVQQRGALYLGDPANRQLSEEDVHFLQVLARQSTVALDAAAWYQTLQTSLQREAATAARNEALVQRLALVIDGVTQLIRLRDPQAMLESVGRILTPLVPHQQFYVRTGELEVRQGDGTTALAEMQALAQKVADQSLPLLLDGPPRLAVPLLSERGCLGALVIAREKQPEFDRADQDILSVLSYQLGSALISAQLYAELQKTHAALRDSQAQLVQSSKMAAVGQLAGGVAHELNTPLGAVALAVEAAQMNLENKPERAAARLERAGKAVQQMKEIVSKLLFYSRDARSGLRETNLNEVLEDTLQLVGHQLRLDNIETIQNLGELPPMLANPNELQQVFTNLILNARDAMLTPGATGKKLALSSGTWDGGVWARVQDQGCGMPAEVLERIFEPFYTTKDVGKGTGLGLSVTSQLVQQHGGKIDVQSLPGQGTRFDVRLPLQPPEAE
jgi:signal transduction histidine kinase